MPCPMLPVLEGKRAVNVGACISGWRLGKSGTVTRKRRKIKALKLTQKACLAASLGNVGRAFCAGKEASALRCALIPRKLQAVWLINQINFICVF